MSYWIQKVSEKIVFDAIVSNTIQEVYLKFRYGHSEVTGTPSVSFSDTGLNIDLSYGWAT